MLAVIVLVEFKPQHLGYGLSRFVLGRFPLRHVTGLRFQSCWAVAMRVASA